MFRNENKEMYTAVPNGTLPPNYKQCAMQGQSLNDLICNNPAGGDIYYGIEGKGLVRINASELSSPNKFSCTNYGSRTPDDAPITLPEDINDPDPTEPKFCYASAQPNIISPLPPKKNTNTTTITNTTKGRPFWEMFLFGLAIVSVITGIIFLVMLMVRRQNKNGEWKPNTLYPQDARSGLDTAYNRSDFAPTVNPLAQYQI